MRVLTLTDCRHGVRHRQETAFLRGQDITRLRRNHHCRWVEVTWIASVVDEGRAPNRCIRRGDTTARQCYAKAF